MECKRCKKPLPSVGFICKSCGAMMDDEQIRFQKEQVKLNNKNMNIELVSEKYGHKDFIYQKRNQENKKYIGILVLVVILILIFFIGLLVYLQ